MEKRSYTTVERFRAAQCCAFRGTMVLTDGSEVDVELKAGSVAKERSSRGVAPLPAADATGSELNLLVYLNGDVGAYVEDNVLSDDARHGRFIDALNELLERANLALLANDLGA